MLLFEERNAVQMLSAPDILWKSRVPPWFIRTVSGEERWTKAVQIFRSAGIILPPVGVWRLSKPVWKCRRLYSVREVQVLLPVATSSSRSGQWGDFWERLQHPSCLSYAFSHCFAAETLMFPNTGALLTGELTPVWSRSWMQIERTRKLYPC